MTGVAGALRIELTPWRMQDINPGLRVRTQVLRRNRAGLGPSGYYARNEVSGCNPGLRVCPLSSIYWLVN